MNFTLPQGRDHVLRLAVYREGQPFPLAGSAIYFSAKLTSDPAEIPALTRSTATGIAILTGTEHAHKCELTFTPALLASLSDLTRYQWDLLVIDADGKSFTPDGLSGEFTVESAITLLPA